MLTKKELLKYPNYLIKKYQNEIYRQLVDYMEKNKLSQKDIAKKLKVSSAYVSQILNGNFNFTLSKLIELGLLMGKIPVIEFADISEIENEKKQGKEKKAGSDISDELFQKSRKRTLQLKEHSYWSYTPKKKSYNEWEVAEKKKYLKLKEKQKVEARGPEPELTKRKK